jgi:hypothetical protein
MDWLGMERELRDLLRDPDNWDDDTLRDTLLCVDEILARYTLRGNSAPFELPEEKRRDMENRFPVHFSWGD